LNTINEQQGIVDAPKDAPMSYCKQIFCDHYQKPCVILAARDAEIERLQRLIDEATKAEVIKKCI
jgi:hypothetical protein